MRETKCKNITNSRCPSAFIHSYYSACPGFGWDRVNFHKKPRGDTAGTDRVNFH